MSALPAHPGSGWLNSTTRYGRVSQALLLAFHLAGIAKHLMVDRDPAALRRMVGR